MANRNGRPRVQAERYANGKPKPKEKSTGPTPEQLRRKHFLIGDSQKGDAESPMGVLVAHGLVDQDVRETITNEYMRAKKKCYGSYGPAMPGDGTARHHDSGDNDADERAARHTIALCDKVLDTLGNRRQRDLFDNFVVRERFPEWMQQRPGQRRLVIALRDSEGGVIPAPEPQLRDLLDILNRLAAEFKIQKRPERAPMVVARNFQKSEEPMVVGRNFQQSVGE